jgi:lipid II:glycine glycyltransferase (peptidoglycan interpeptide bridge formation enzyme)
VEAGEETDRDAWDARILALGGHPLQSWAWGELKQRFGWRPVRLVTDDRGPAAQVLVRPLVGLSVAYVPRGPVLGESGAGDAVARAVERVSRRHRAAFLRCEPNVALGTPFAHAVDERLRARRYREAARTVQPRASLVLDLTPATDAIWASFSKGHRADVRRAEREGVRTRIGNAADAEILHGLLQATQQRKEFGIHSAAYYRTLLEVFGSAARLFVAEHGGAPVAAILALAWGEHGIYLVAGSNEDGLRHRAGHLLQWHAIQWTRESGARTYDLWGIPDARARLELAPPADPSELTQLEKTARSDPLDGVYRYKKGWGAVAVRMLPAYDRVWFPPAYWLWLRRRGAAG